MFHGSFGRDFRLAALSATIVATTATCSSFRRFFILKDHFDVDVAWCLWCDLSVYPEDPGFQGHGLHCMGLYESSEQFDYQKV